MFLFKIILLAQVALSQVIQVRGDNSTGLRAMQRNTPKYLNVPLRHKSCNSGSYPVRGFIPERVLSREMIDYEANGRRACRLLVARRKFQTSINECQAPRKQGECTEWADGRYYMLTGRHAEFNGDAKYWANMASRSRKWRVTRRPVIPSIFVIPGNNKQGDFITGPAGHVGVVEGILRDGRICTSNWNAPKRMRLSLSAIRVTRSTKFISAR